MGGYVGSSSRRPPTSCWFAADTSGTRTGLPPGTSREDHMDRGHHATANGCSNRMAETSTGQCCEFSSEAVLLRWTAAIKAKVEKLRGDPTQGKVGYLASGIVHEEDAYVIAVNGLLLRGGGFGKGGGFPQLEGISQFPLAVEATYAVGPYSITIDRMTLGRVAAGHSYRPSLMRPKGADVPADTFHDPNFAPVSAVWAVDIGYGSTLHTPQAMAVVHNPLAKNPIPSHLLPAYEEFTLELAADEMAVKRYPGSEFMEKAMSLSASGYSATFEPCPKNLPLTP